LASGAVQPQVSNSQWSAIEESKRERGRIMFRSQEQLREMCCIDHKLEHLSRGSRMFRYVFCFGRKAAKLHVFCENGPEVSVELLKPVRTTSSSTDGNKFDTGLSLNEFLLLSTV
jgi:hypothetical protein